MKNSETEAEAKAAEETEEILQIDPSELDELRDLDASDGKGTKRGRGKQKNRQRGKKKRSIQSVLIRLSVIPVLVLGIILTFSMIRILDSNMEKELSETLDVAANSLYNTYSLLAAGDYEMREDRLYKGDMLLTGSYDVVDALKKAYKLDISLYYGDRRVLTTITDDSGRRIVGTKADERTKYWVIDCNRKYFAKDLIIAGRRYYGYYVPMLNRDGSVVGMAFAGREATEVRKVLNHALLRAGVISALAIFFTLLFCIAANHQITSALHAIQEYLGALAGGSFDMKMPAKVQRRTDEIGDMGRYAIEVSDALEKKVTTDPLTGLLNRRACNSRLEKLLELSARDETMRLTVALGDIDFFKSVNDRYGHECGDIVLKAVSDILQREVAADGFAARWGGEEFLLVIRAHVDDVIVRLNEILWQIRSYRFEYEDYEPFQITMSLGVTGRTWDKELDEVIREADEALYQCKNTGRNRIVTTDGRVLLPDGEYSTLEEQIRLYEQKCATEEAEAEGQLAEELAEELEEAEEDIQNGTGTVL